MKDPQGRPHDPRCALCGGWGSRIVTVGDVEDPRTPLGRIPIREIRECEACHGTGTERAP